MKGVTCAFTGRLGLLELIIDCQPDGRGTVQVAAGIVFEVLEIEGEGCAEATGDWEQPMLPPITMINPTMRPRLLPDVAAASNNPN